MQQGKNFDVLTCASCKAFFRRTAPKNKCKINVKTRTFCIKCRLKKCYEKGMKKDYILSREVKEMRKIKCLNSDWSHTTGAVDDTNYQYYYASDNSSTDNTGDWTPTTDKNLENYDPFPQTVYTLPDPNAGPLDLVH
ncbi:unnamed protein product [Oppiella nova]|uniref:Nuclear receptor domain-containing protein n=1 Tax=Oppiella nova TaxID=334625 RepID=A0A7R9QQR0_9ACAR|nr:unnamed protein product [Oppiella nova]CAG2172124.1 unnamed protein product [Oppiella nova]